MQEGCSVGWLIMYILCAIVDSPLAIKPRGNVQVNLADCNDEKSVVR